MNSRLLIVLLAIVFTSCSMEKLYTMKQSRKVYPFEQVNFHELVQRYMSKENSSIGTIEGIYSVSLVVTKKGKGLMSSVERERIIERKENYSKVAIIRDAGDANREYFEVSLDNESLPSYSVRGEFTRMTEANILIYNRLEPRGKTSTYTFTYDYSRDILEGVRKENSGQAEYTYNLTYIKLHPKKTDLTNNN
jgi:hypothetical protein